MISLDLPGPVRVTSPLAWSPIRYLRYAYSAISIRKATKQSIIEMKDNSVAMSSADIFGTKEASSAAKVTTAPVILRVSFQRFVDSFPPSNLLTGWTARPRVHEDAMEIVELLATSVT